MGRYVVVLNNGEGVVEKVNTEATLREVREQLEKLGYTELNTTYRGGKHIVTFLNYKIAKEKLQEQLDYKYNPTVR